VFGVPGYLGGLGTSCQAEMPDIEITAAFAQVVKALAVGIPDGGEFTAGELGEALEAVVLLLPQPDVASKGGDVVLTHIVFKAGVLAVKQTFLLGVKNRFHGWQGQQLGGAAAFDRHLVKLGQGPVVGKLRMLGPIKSSGGEKNVFAIGGEAAGSIGAAVEGQPSDLAAAGRGDKNIPVAVAITGKSHPFTIGGPDGVLVVCLVNCQDRCQAPFGGHGVQVSVEIKSHGLSIRADGRMAQPQRTVVLGQGGRGAGKH